MQCLTRAAPPPPVPPSPRGNAETSEKKRGLPEECDTAQNDPEMQKAPRSSRLEHRRMEVATLEQELSKKHVAKREGRGGGELRSMNLEKTADRKNEIAEIWKNIAEMEAPSPPVAASSSASARTRERKKCACLMAPTAWARRRS